MHTTFTKQFDLIKRDLFSWSRKGLFLLKKVKVVMAYALVKINNVVVIVTKPPDNILRSIDLSTQAHTTSPRKKWYSQKRSLEAKKFQISDSKFRQYRQARSGGPTSEI